LLSYSNFVEVQVLNHLIDINKLCTFWSKVALLLSSGPKVL